MQSTLFCCCPWLGLCCEHVGPARSREVAVGVSEEGRGSTEASEGEPCSPSPSQSEPGHCVVSSRFKNLMTWQFIITTCSLKKQKSVVFKPDRPARNTRAQLGYTDPSKQTWEPFRTLGSGKHQVTADTITLAPKTSQKVHHPEGKGNNLRALDLSYILGVRRRDKWSSTHLRGDPRCPGLPGQVFGGVRWCPGEDGAQPHTHTCSDLQNAGTWALATKS